MDIKKAIEDKAATLRNAYNRGDSTGCAAFFTEDVIMLPPDQPMTRGRKAFEEIMQSRMGKASGAACCEPRADLSLGRV